MFKGNNINLQIFRHGDRSPVGTYPNDPYKEEDWPQGYNQLSFVSEVLLMNFKLNISICVITMYNYTEWYTTTLSAGQIDKETLYSRTSID